MIFHKWHIKIDSYMFKTLNWGQVQWLHFPQQYLKYTQKIKQKSPAYLQVAISERRQLYSTSNHWRRKSQRFYLYWSALSHGKVELLWKRVRKVLSSDKQLSKINLHPSSLSRRRSNGKNLGKNNTRKGTFLKSCILSPQ